MAGQRQGQASDLRGSSGEITPWTFKAIFGASATSLLLIAKALDRIATEYERRGQHG